MRSASSRRVLLAVLAALAVAVQLRVTLDVVRRTERRRDLARWPFGVAQTNGTIVGLESEAASAGLEQGDRLVTLAGRPVRGLADSVGALHGRSAGTVLPVVVERNGGGRFDTSVTLALDSVAQTSGVLLTVWALRFFMPWFCLAIGLWAAFVRPDDRRAWLLLFLMATFTDPFGRGQYAHWEPGLRELGRAWGTLATSLWPLAMMTFGVWFPERLGLDARFPWPRRIASFVLLVFAGIRATGDLLCLHSFAAGAGTIRFLDSLSLPLFVLGMAAVSTFFAGQGIRHGEQLPPDARRRLILSQAGTTIALLPAFVLVLLSLFTQRELDEVVPTWVLLPSLGLVLLFPLTLAYVVVVERALDVRLVIRQGLRYALERRGIFVLRIVLTAAIAGRTLYAVTRQGSRRVEVVGAMAVGALLVVLLQRMGEATLRWTDRRFFREAVDSERVLTALADEVRSEVDRGAIVDIVGRRLAESLHVEKLAVLVRDGDRYVAPDLVLPGASAIVSRIAKTREPARVHDDDGDALRDFGAQVVLPLPARDHLAGIVVLGPRKAEAPYSAADMQMLRSLGIQVGLALDNSRLTAAVAAEAAQRGRLAREVEIAREVQQRLFPQQVPKVAGLDLAGHCRTALGVGGDYYDFLVLPDGSLLLAIGDVSGKGIGAALVMASLQASLRGQSFRASGELARLMETVNSLVHDATPENRYATLFVGRYEPPSGRLVYVNGGHNPPMLLRAGGDVVRLKATGTVVGLLEAATYQEAEVDVEAGDLLCGFSDGISEAMTEDDEEYGEARLLAALRASSGVELKTLIERIFADADAFTAGAPQYDDMTVIVARATSRA